jgi:hypothetical protein
MGIPLLSWEVNKGTNLLYRMFLIGKFLGEMHGAYFLLSYCLLGHLLSVSSDGCWQWQWEWENLLGMPSKSSEGLHLG